MTGTIWTIGHSNRTLEAFLDLLLENGIRLVADIRRFPASRKHPHFNQERLPAELEKAGIAYRHFPELGGRRSRRLPGSANTAWRVEAFNAYADHMSSPEFDAALTDLIALAQRKPAVLMCAEALPWRCHRRIIADAFVARGWEVLDIFGPGKVKKHPLTPFAQVGDGRVTYPGV
jgi:uncharacterized protein (DUF488 family)